MQRIWGKGILPYILPKGVPPGRFDAVYLDQH